MTSLPCPGTPVLVRLTNAAAPALRLICFPHAGAGARTFRLWTSAFPVDVDLCEMKLPGRDFGAHTEPLRRMTPLVDGAVAKLMPLLDRPYALFGHSLGALAAFEAARELARRGQPAPELLVVSGCPAPPQAVAAAPKTADMSDAEFCAHLREAYGLPDMLLGNAELMAITLPLIRAEFEIYETYQYRSGVPLACPIVGLCGDQDAQVEPDTMRRWADETCGGYLQHVVAGDHFFPTASAGAVTTVIRGQIEAVLMRGACS